MIKVSNAAMNGLKMIHTTNQTVIEKLKNEVEELNELLQRNMQHVFVQEIAGITVGGDDNSVFADLQAELDQYADEKAELLARLGEYEEILKQSRESGSVPTIAIPSASPPMNIPPPPKAPPLDMGKSCGGVSGNTGGSGGDLDLSNVKLKKAEPNQKPVSSTSDLLNENTSGSSGTAISI